MTTEHKTTEHKTTEHKTTECMYSPWLEQIRWNADGLIPAIAQDEVSGEILMMAWMNDESLALTVETGKAVYWSRSRQQLWQKGERSGHTQQVREIFLDCDGDTLVLKVTQTGGIACHTGRRSCFFQALNQDANPPVWEVAAPVLKHPDTLYSNT